MQLTVDQAASSVVFLRGATPDGRESMGTGFLILAPDTLYLVTCEHVATAIGSDPSLTFGGANDVAQTYALRALGGTSPVRWIHHGTADVSAMEISGDPAAMEVLKPRALSLGHIFSNFDAPSRERPLTTFGFPLGLGAVKERSGDRVSPLAMESRAASGLMTMKRFDRVIPQVVFILQNPSIGGYSGAPVFKLPSTFSAGGAIAFSKPDGHVMGLVHGTLSDATGGKLAAVVPVAYVTELLERAFNVRNAIDP